MPPQWLDLLTPLMNSEGSKTVRPAMKRRLAALAGRWHVLDYEAWRRLDYTARRIVLEHCLPVAGRAAPAVEAVVALLRRAEASEAVTYTEWQAVQGTASQACCEARAAAGPSARAAAAAASPATRSSARAAARETEIAAEAAAGAALLAADDTSKSGVRGAMGRARDAAKAAALATARSARAAARSAKRDARTTARAAARDAEAAELTAARVAIDRITVAILSVIEQACDVVVRQEAKP